MVCSAVRNNNGNYPNGFLVDFEAAAINAIRNILPRTDISGCFFHLLSNLWCPACWITKTLHERPPIWFTVMYDCYFRLRSPTGFG